VHVFVILQTGSTALHLAAWNNSTNWAVKLISYGANVNQMDEIGNTPLHHACQNVHEEMARILIAADADPSIKNYVRSIISFKINKY